MLSVFTDFFIKYAKNVSSGRMIIHALLFLAMTSWVGAVIILTVNFPLVEKIYEQYYNSKSIEINKSLHVSEQVNDIIARQRALLGVDRLYISKFHDGKVDLNGIHFIFFSRVAESDNIGVANELTQSQGIPLSIFPGMVSALVKNKCFSISNTLRGKKPSDSFFVSTGVNSIVICPIKIDGRLIGIIGAEGVITRINIDKIGPRLTTISTIIGRVIVN